MVQFSLVTSVKNLKTKEFKKFAVNYSPES